jgi:hypothetical protein
VIKLYDFDLKKEVPKTVPMLTDVIGKEVSLAILKVLENKNEKDADGNYVAIADTRETNVVDKVFHTESRMSVVEARNEATEAKFWDGWVEKNKDQVRDKRTIKDGAQAGTAGKPPSASSAPAGAAPRKSLFGK